MTWLIKFYLSVVFNFLIGFFSLANSQIAGTSIYVSISTSRSVITCRSAKVWELKYIVVIGENNTEYELISKTSIFDETWTWLFDVEYRRNSSGGRITARNLDASVQNACRIIDIPLTIIIGNGVKADFNAILLNLRMYNLIDGF